MDYSKGGVCTAAVDLAHTLPELHLNVCVCFITAWIMFTMKRFTES